MIRGKQSVRAKHGRTRQSAVKKMNRVRRSLSKARKQMRDLKSKKKPKAKKKSKAKPKKLTAKSKKTIKQWEKILKKKGISHHHKKAGAAAAGAGTETEVDKYRGRFIFALEMAEKCKKDLENAEKTIAELKEGIRSEPGGGGGMDDWEKKSLNQLLQQNVKADAARGASKAAVDELASKVKGSKLKKKREIKEFMDSTQQMIDRHKGVRMD